MKTTKLALAFLLATTLLGCGGGGGGSSSLVFPPPKVVLATSYENKHTIMLDDPDVTALPGANPKAVAFGDFFQEGEYSAFVAVSVGASLEARFLKKNGSTWTDDTVKLMANASNRGVCASAAQALTADFNGDGKPDIFLACGMSSTSEQYIVMSQAGTTSYVSQTIKNQSGQSIQLQGWGAAAADIDGDGDADIVMAQNNEIVVLENQIKSNGYWVLHSSANSNVWIDLPNPALNFPTLPRKVFLIPRSGLRPDLAVGGDGSVGNITLAWMQSLNSSTPPYYRFNQNSSESAYANMYRMANNNAGSVYDIVKKGTDLIVLTKDRNLTDESIAAQMVLLRYGLPVNLTSGFSNSPTLISYTGNSAPNFISQFKLNSVGQLVAYDGACVAGETRCSFSASP
jgi:hypothetical protein